MIRRSPPADHAPVSGRMSRGTRWGWIAFGVVVAAALSWIVRELATDNAMSGQGWIALMLGILGTCGLAAVLMWLLFRSHDHEHRHM